MKKIVLALRCLFLYTLFLLLPTSIHAQASNCCRPWNSIGSACTTLSGSYGSCSTSGNVEPYLSQCTTANPPVLSCLPNCSGVYCPSGAVAGSSCTTVNGNYGTCTNAPHIEPYLSECPGSSGQLACLSVQPPPGCCLPSQQGQSCLINPTTLGTCRAPSGTLETTQCPLWNICAAPTSSGSYTCECTNTAFGFNCQPGPTNTCQSGNMPNITECSADNTTNPCGGNASYSSCQLPCVPGGYMAWGDHFCTPPDPNAIPPIPLAELCLPGLVCQNGFCMKPDGSVNFSEACIWDRECGTCNTSNGCTTQMHCAHHIPGEPIGMCDGVCGGQGPSDCVNITCNGEVGTVRTAIGCINVSDPKTMINQLLSWAIKIASGILLLNLLYAGILFVTSSGDEKQITASKQLLSSSMLGFSIIALSILILNLLGVRILGLHLFGLLV